MEAVRRGAGGEQAHEAIKEHAVAVALQMREQAMAYNDLAQRLGEDARLPLTTAEIEALLERSQDFTGLAAAQTEAFVAQVAQVGQRYPAASQVRKSRLL
jgi:adenylosuccinate lyase